MISNNELIGYLYGRKNGHVPRAMTPEEIKNVRLKVGLNQRNFCIRYGLPFGTLRNWEQGRNCTDIAASLFLYQIDKHPFTTAKNVVGWIKISRKELEDIEFIV